MPKYLLDTNIVLRLSNPTDAQHELVAAAISTLLKQSNECCLVAQVLIEMWTVATRPTKVNGMGWSADETRSKINQLLNRFPIVEESSQILSTWLSLVTENKILGKHTHDARLVALMQATNISHILTLNPKDFVGFSMIATVHPKEIVEAGTK